MPSDHRVKVKESKNLDKYLGFARELINLWIIKIAIVVVANEAHGTDPNNPENRQGNSRLEE